MFEKALGLDFRNILQVCFGNVISSADQHFETKTSLKISQARTPCVAICKADIFMHCYVRLRLYIYTMYLYLWLILTYLHLIHDIFEMMKCWTTRLSIFRGICRAAGRPQNFAKSRTSPTQEMWLSYRPCYGIRFIAGFAHLEIKHEFKVFCKSWLLISGFVGRVCSMIFTFCNEYLVLVYYRHIYILI